MFLISEQFPNLLIALKLEFYALDQQQQMHKVMVKHRLICLHSLYLRLPSRQYFLNGIAFSSILFWV